MKHSLDVLENGLPSLPASNTFRSGVYIMDSWKPMASTASPIIKPATHSSNVNTYQRAFEHGTCTRPATDSSNVNTYQRVLGHITCTRPATDSSHLNTYQRVFGHVTCTRPATDGSHLNTYQRVFGHGNVLDLQPTAAI